MHTRDLIKKGVKVEKLALVQACKEGGSLFSETERAVLAWAESVTRVAETGVPDSAYKAARVLAQWEIIVGKEGRNPTFEEYWEAGAIGFAEDLIPPDSLEGCRARGFNGLLEIRTVRLAVGALISLIYSQIVGEGLQSGPEQREPRTPQRGDAYDLWHAILASSADAIVTYDERFVASLRRVPIDSFQVFSSVPELLQSMQQA
jgi:hypothetical protein